MKFNMIVNWIILKLTSESTSKPAHKCNKMILMAIFLIITNELDTVNDSNRNRKPSWNQQEFQVDLTVDFKVDDGVQRIDSVPANNSKLIECNQLHWVTLKWI